jgi:hypothetical protein
VASGQSLSLSLRVAIIDDYGNIVNTDNTSLGEIVPVNPNTTTLSGVTKVNANEGIFDFSAFKISAAPGTTVGIRIETNAIDPS